MKILMLRVVLLSLVIAGSWAAYVGYRTPEAKPVATSPRAEQGSDARLLVLMVAQREDLIQAQQVAVFWFIKYYAMQACIVEAAKAKTEAVMCIEGMTST